MFKKIILGLIVISALSTNVRAEDMDPVTATVIWTVGSAAGALIGYAGVESYNQLNTDQTTTNTMDNTTTFTTDTNDTNQLGRN